MRSPDTVLSDWRNRVQDNGIRASRIAVGLGAAVVLIVILSAVTSAWVLREQAINEWRRHLSNLSVILAEQTSLVVSSTYLVLDDITEEIKRSSITDAAALRRQTSGPATYEMLREKTRNSRWIDVATIVDAHGDVINFSRSFPAPPINVADRDYFRAHAANPGLGVFISAPVRNRGTGAWTFYISRRLNGANGELAGLVLVGLSTQFFSEFYQLIHLESDASISLYRRDFTLLARYPHAEEVIGKVNRTGSSYQVIEVEKKTADVIVTTSPRFVEGGRSIYRMGAPRLVEKYPLIVNVTITGELFLEGWRRSATLIAGIALVSVVALIVCFILLVRLLRRRESDLELTLLLKRQAEAANLAKTESMQELEAFSYSVSHDLRAPLRAISGYADLVAANLAGQLAGENAHYLTRLKASARRMNQLIDDFLLLSRAARSEPRRKQVDLSQLAREVIDALVQQHPEHKVEVTIAPGMTAHGDPNLLRIVLENLLGNAWKYTNSAEAPRIEFGSEAGAGETVFFVRDNGVGFDMRYADKLFVPFQRLHTASEFEGSGIGLATVQRIVRRHGGRVWAKAEVNRGATFYFALPVS